MVSRDIRSLKAQSMVIVVFIALGVIISLVVHLQLGYLFSPWWTVIFPALYSGILGFGCHQFLRRFFPELFAENSSENLRFNFEEKKPVSTKKKITVQKRFFLDFFRSMRKDKKTSTVKQRDMDLAGDSSEATEINQTKKTKNKDSEQKRVGNLETSDEFSDTGDINREKSLEKSTEKVAEAVRVMMKDD